MKENKLLKQQEERRKNAQGYKICKKVQARSKYFQGT